MRIKITIGGRETVHDLATGPVTIQGVPAVVELVREPQAVVPCAEWDRAAVARAGGHVRIDDVRCQREARRVVLAGHPVRVSRPLCDGHARQVIDRHLTTGERRVKSRGLQVLDEWAAEIEAARPAPPEWATARMVLVGGDMLSGGGMWRQGPRGRWRMIDDTRSAALTTHELAAAYEEITALPSFGVFDTYGPQE